jgi:GNAT superfamily N-acetyltransferase
MIFDPPDEIRSGTEKLRRDHDLSRFDCGAPSLNDWLKRFALSNQQADAAQTYIACRRNRVIGYYSLVAGSVQRSDAPERIAKGLANHPVGVILLARLAVDLTEKGHGLGKALLKDALSRIAQAADLIGARAVLVHTIDEDAKRFYQHFNFEVAPIDPMHLMLLMKDLRNLLR